MLFSENNTEVGLVMKWLRAKTEKDQNKTTNRRDDR
jgi:hypothetical protein